MSKQPQNDESLEDQALERLRQILIGPERQRLVELKEEVEQQSVDPEDLSRALPQAFLAREAEDRELSHAMLPSVERAVEASVRRNPHVLTEAIFPIIGPAIRRSIRQALTELSDSINRTLDQYLSPKGLRMRFDAWRTGVPFSEIVLKNSLTCRVEQVFLIHQETGLLLAHATRSPTLANDPELVSSMLGAISDFVSDSFESGSDEGITQIEFGERLLEVARGPGAILVCEIRGVCTADLRTGMQESIEAIHSERAGELLEFDGDCRAFEQTTWRLEDLLVERVLNEKKKKKSIGIAHVVLALVTLGVFGLALQMLMNHRDQNLRWENARVALANEPGITVMAQVEDGKRYVVSGIRDPLARDPVQVMVEAGLQEDRIFGNWFLSASDHLTIVRKRAEQLLAPPESVQLSWTEACVNVSGVAEHRWIQHARKLFSDGQLPGVEALTQVGFSDRDVVEAENQAKAIGARSLRFAPDSARLQTDSDFDPIAVMFSTFDQYCRKHDLLFRIRIDISASTGGQQPLLDMQRREHIHDLLIQASQAAGELQFVRSIATAGTAGSAIIHLELVGESR